MAFFAIPDTPHVSKSILKCVRAVFSNQGIRVRAQDVDACLFTLVTRHHSKHMLNHE